MQQLSFFGIRLGKNKFRFPAVFRVEPIVLAVLAGFAGQ